MHSNLKAVLPLQCEWRLRFLNGESDNDVSLCVNSVILVIYTQIDHRGCDIEKELTTPQRSQFTPILTATTIECNGTL